MAFPVTLAVLAALGLALNLSAPRRIARQIPTWEQDQLDRGLLSTLDTRHRSAWAIAAFSTAAAVSEVVLDRWPAVAWACAAVLSALSALAHRHTDPRVRQVLLEAGARRPARRAAGIEQRRQVGRFLDAGAVVATCGACLSLGVRHQDAGPVAHVLPGVGLMAFVVGLGLLTAAVVLPGLHREER